MNPSHIQTIQIISTTVIAVATIIYAYLTYIIVKETRRLREVQVEPEIVLYLQPSENNPSFIYIIVRNIGASPAYNLKWTFDKNSPLLTIKNVNLLEIKFFDGIDFFAPGQEFISFLETGPNLLSDPIPPPLEMNLKFSNRRGDEFFRKFLLNPKQFSGRLYIKNENLKEISKHLKNISTQIGLSTKESK